MTLRGTAVASALLAAAALGWAVVLALRGAMMDGAPAYLGVWVAMTVAMMLPSAAPMLLLVDRLARAATAPFAAGYLVVWSAAGAAAYAWTWRVSWGGTAVVLALAGLYQLLPAKRACLRRCRHPLAFLRTHAGDAPFVAGLRHGVLCVGCCAGLMAVLLALGMASILWMTVVGAVVLAEKTLPRGEAVAKATAAALLGVAAWLVLA